MALPVPATTGMLRSLGPYQLQEVLGEGGMGVVYLAVHRSSGERVAIKTVKVPHEQHLAGIRREIQALSRLRHPGVVRVLETGFQDSVPWYAMEYLEGETLGSLKERGFEGSAARFASGEVRVPRAAPSSAPDQPTLASNEMLDAPAGPSRPLFGPAAGGKLPEVLTILRRLCATLSYLHGEGVMHRDLKPSNIFVQPRQRPVLVDFGLVWRFGGGGREVLDVSQMEAGTVAYMAPEHFRGEFSDARSDRRLFLRVNRRGGEFSDARSDHCRDCGCITWAGEFSDARSDLYSLGCILYEMITGRLSFEGSTLLEIRSGHLALSPTPPSALVDGVPAALDQLVLRLLEKQPRQRIGHAADVEEVLASLGAEADPQVSPVRTRAYVYRPALVGREEAMQQLQGALERAERGDGGVLLLEGESGIGKTYLAMAFARRAMAQGFTVVADSCAPGQDLEGNTDTPLLPFRRFLQAISDRCVEMGPDTTALLLGPSLHLLAPYEPSLGELPGAEFFAPPPELAAQAARARLIQAIHGVIRAFLEASPLLLMVDDLQWIDDLSAQVLAELPEELFRSRLMVLGTFRSEQRTEAIRRLLAPPGEGVRSGAAGGGQRGRAGLGHAGDGAPARAAGEGAHQPVPREPVLRGGVPPGGGGGGPADPEPREVAGRQRR
jgi:serine/threonine protein kinase